MKMAKWTTARKKKLQDGHERAQMKETTAFSLCSWPLKRVLFEHNVFIVFCNHTNRNENEHASIYIRIHCTLWVRIQHIKSLYEATELLQKRLIFIVLYRWFDVKIDWQWSILINFSMRVKVPVWNANIELTEIRKWFSLENTISYKLMNKCRIDLPLLIE